MVFYLAYVPSGKIRRFNEIGDYSYGMYIYAFPVQQSIASLIPNVSIFTMILLSFFITFILAFLSWNCIEKKALKKKDSYIVFKVFLQNICLTIASAKPIVNRTLMRGKVLRLRAFKVKTIKIKTLIQKA